MNKGIFSARTTFINLNTKLNAGLTPRKHQLRNKNNHQKALLFKKKHHSSLSQQSTPFDLKNWFKQVRSNRKERAKSVENLESRGNSVLMGNQDILMGLYGTLRVNERSVNIPSSVSARVHRASTQPAKNLKISLKQVNKMSGTSKKKMLIYCTREFKSQMKERPQPQLGNRNVKNKALVARNFIRRNLAQEHNRLMRKRPAITESQVKMALVPSQPIPITTSRSNLYKTRRDWGLQAETHGYSRLAQV